MYTDEAESIDNGGRHELKVKYKRIERTERKITRIDTRTIERSTSVNDIENRCGIEISQSFDDPSVELVLSSDSFSGEEDDKLYVLDLELEICGLKEESLKKNFECESLSKINQSIKEERDELKAIAKDYSKKIQGLQSSLSHKEKSKYHELKKEHESAKLERNSFKDLTGKYLEQIPKIASKLEDNKSSLELDIAKEKEKYSLLQKQHEETGLEKEHFKALNEEYAVEISALSKLKDDYMQQRQEYEQLKAQNEFILTQKNELQTRYENESSNQSLLLQQEKIKYLELERRHEDACDEIAELEDKVHDCKNQVQTLQDQLAHSEDQYLKRREQDKNTILELQKQVNNYKKAQEKDLMTSILEFMHRLLQPFHEKQITAKAEKDDALKFSMFSVIHKFLHDFRCRFDFSTKLLKDSKREEDGEEKRNVLLSKKEIVSMLQDG